jgi:predicted amidohydrolase
MRIALIQTAPRMLCVEANLRGALQLMREAAADLYVLPELFGSGYSFAASDEVERVAEAAQAGPTLEAMGEFARFAHAFVAYGFPERAGSRYFNAATLVGPGGRLGTYRKIHLFGREKLFFSAGEAVPPVFDLPCGRVGMMICFDWYFPEVARSLALRGADVIAHPANLVLPNCPAGMVTRALENRVYAATCDRVGREMNGPASHHFIGNSQVVSPTGEILARLSEDREEAVVVEADIARARVKAVGQHNDLFADRAPALYEGIGL